MTNTHIPYLYQLQNATFTSLSATNFSVGVVDMDDSQLSSSEVGQLQAQGKTVFTYLSIGEAEDYRDYWIDGNWSQTPPDFALGENPQWAGNFYVKFWDTDWQSIIMGRVADAVALGYEGIYLDIVDGFMVDEIVAAYGGKDIRADMEQFVMAISEYAKSLNPDFKVIPQNAVELLAEADDSSVANQDYIDAIDGVGVEDLFYADNSVATWSKWDVEYLQHVVNAGKFVLSTSYPTQLEKQISFVEQAVELGFLVFVANRMLDGKVADINYEIMEMLKEGALEVVIGTSVPDVVKVPEGPEVIVVVEEKNVEEVEKTEPPVIKNKEEEGQQEQEEEVIEEVEIDVTPMVVVGTKKDDVLSGGDGDDFIKGNAGQDSLEGGKGDDHMRGGKNDDVLNGGQGDDSLKGDKDNDVLDGGEGNDLLRGGKGDDTLIGGGGDDLIRGDKGADTFVFGDVSGQDTVKGFDADEGDMILLMMSGVNEENVMDLVSYSKKGALITFSESDSVFLHRVKEGELSTDDFSFI